MKSGLKTLLIILGVVFVLGFMVYRFFVGNYNKMVELDEGVKAAWGQVENQYQRRMDLVPNLVATVKGYAGHEAQVLTEVTQARAKAGGVMDVSDEVLNNPEAFEKFQKAQSQLSGALQRLLVVTENYPDLKASENFLALQDQLEGTENRISTERRRFNETVKTYNTFIRKFPASIIANMNGFTVKSVFKATEGADTAPKVEF
ncbi:MAG: LemA family protein [Treponema sp.]|nr:MAG: LemA family protein [Treponema sp.]